MDERFLPIGIQDFEDLSRRGFIYVDKTAFIYKLAREGKPYFLSRPRRFRKSLLLSTMEYYFTHNIEGAYNPFCLLKCLRYKDFGSYWFESGTPSFLVKSIQNQPLEEGNRPEKAKKSKTMSKTHWNLAGRGGRIKESLY